MDAFAEPRLRETPVPVRRRLRSRLTMLLLCLLVLGVIGAAFWYRPTPSADPTRSRGLASLLDQPCRPAELARDLDLTRTNVSNHLLIRFNLN